MNYISMLNSDERKVLCSLLPHGFLKDAFQKNPKEFTKISSFRPKAISEEKAAELAAKHINSPFLNSVINKIVEQLISEINEAISDYSATYNIETSIGMAIGRSYFAPDPKLFLKLSGSEYTPAQIETICTVAAKTEEEAMQELREQKEKMEAEKMARSKKAEEARIAQLKAEQEKELATLRDELAQAAARAESAEGKVAAITSKYDSAISELECLRERAAYEENAAIRLASQHDNEYLSICRVTEPDANGRRWLQRLADISSEGRISVFIQNTEISWHFGNNSRLFQMDGPTDTGTIGVWDWAWYAREDNHEKDRVDTKYRQDIAPIEIIFVQGDNILTQLKVGIPSTPHSSRALFSMHIGKGVYSGILCHARDLDCTGGVARLREDVFSLPRYEFRTDSIVKLTGKDSFYRNINLGMPTEIIRVMEPMQAVKAIIMLRSSLAALNSKGANRSDWVAAREFLSGIDSHTVCDDISKYLGCTADEADRFLQEFLAYAHEYIDGSSIEDRLLAAVISKNTGLQKRCKDLLTEEWTAENQKRIESASKKLEQINQETVDTERKIAEVQMHYDALIQQKSALEEQISEKEKLAADVEAAVASRIQQAKNSAADFIASMAFVPQATIHANSSPAPVQSKLIAGTALPKDDVSEHRSWKDTLDAVEDNLAEAGVIKDYARPFAAYLYSAYCAKVPLLLAGPNAEAIADAFSAAIYGKTAGTLDCSQGYSASCAASLVDCDDSVIKLIEPFHPNWVNKLPRIFTATDKFFIAVHPFTEDIQIEPKSIFAYMLPVLTELLVDEKPMTVEFGGICSAEYSPMPMSKATPKYNPVLKGLRASAIMQSRLAVVLANMESILKAENSDHAVLLGLFPYAYATMQHHALLEKLSSSGRLSVSKVVLDVLNNLYGDLG